MDNMGCNFNHIFVERGIARSEKKNGRDIYPAIFYFLEAELNIDDKYTIKGNQTIGA